MDRSHAGPSGNARVGAAGTQRALSREGSRGRAGRSRFGTRGSQDPHRVRALLSLAPGGPETLKLSELPDPQPGPGELLVKVRACAINYPDVLIIEDKYQFRPE